ncbi:hypothetical protein DSO57_1008620 [Entomophthora muscae]|uniref:Uncharacterized protein n=1 Tax=Entomophthora muscae TaxID=34485 RepID=A0ACC2RY33_9FUNG|nr:hypothetical protein DSO57_1008620 [Entomophthora muscae]
MSSWMLSPGAKHNKGPENLPNANNQVVEQKDPRVNSTVTANGSLPAPDATLPALES